MADAPSELVAAAHAAADLLGDAMLPPLPDAVVASLPKVCRLALGAAACSIAVADDDEVRYLAADGAGADGIVGRRLPLGRGIAGWVVASGEALAVSDLEQDPRFNRTVAEETGYVPSRMLVLPLLYGDSVVGAMSVLDPDRLDADGMGAAKVFADHAALTIVQAREAVRLGRVLLGAIERAAGDGSDLTVALEAAAGGDGPWSQREPAAIASVFRRLALLGDLERELALDLLHDAVSYVERRRERD